jgi:hypothetical protein
VVDFVIKQEVECTDEVFKVVMQVELLTLEDHHEPVVHHFDLVHVTGKVLQALFQSFQVLLFFLKIKI